jgi:hypothetical protein
MLMIWKTACAALTLLLLGAWCVPAAAQGRGPFGGCGEGGWGRSGAYFSHFDPAKVETLSGEVVSVQQVSPVKGVSQGVHLVLKTAREQISVHLGPAWYIDNQEPTIQPKDKLEITGSRVSLNGKVVIIASEVRKGDTSLKLRDGEGHPAWCGWRRR